MQDRKGVSLVKGNGKGGGVRRGSEEESDVFLTTEENNKLGETQKVTLFDDDWEEKEIGEPKWYSVPRKVMSENHLGTTRENC